MHLTGIIDNNNTQEVLAAIKFFLSVENRKVSIAEYGNHITDRGTWHNYWSALNLSGIEILIVRIREKELTDAMDILPLDALIVNDYTQWSKAFSTIRKEQKHSFKNLVVILNSDVIKRSYFSDEKKYRLLRYGFSSDSNITTSSTGEPSISGQFLCCIREKLKSANGKIIEPQEFVMNLENTTKDPYNILAAASFAVYHDIDLNKVHDRH